MDNLAFRSLTKQQVRQFKLNGFLVVSDVLSTDEIKALAAQTDLIAAGNVEHIPETSIQLERIFRDGEQTVTN